MERRLAAIVIADVVGYTKLIRLDEAGTRARFQALSKNVFEPAVIGHGGRIIKTMGDAFLIEFSSAVEAVACAVEVQQAVSEQESGVAPEHRIHFRVGINLGDIIVEGDDIHGDGVNVAARLEPISPHGGICVSDKVYHEVRGKLGLEFTDAGVRSLKNIDEPVHVYFHGGEITTAAAGGAESAVASEKSGVDTIPLISVRPFKVIGRSEDADALAEGLREVIISGLAAQAALAVTRADEETNADFVLEGGVRSSGDKVRANFTLHDQAKGSEVWGERYDRTMDDLFELEDEISASVVSVIRVRLKALEMERLERADNAELSVPQLLSKAAGYFVRTPGENAVVEEILELALKKAPDNSMAHAMMAFCKWRALE
jgi:adenylate cyclase